MQYEAREVVGLRPGCSEAGGSEVAASDGEVIDIFAFILAARFVPFVAFGC